MNRGAFISLVYIVLFTSKLTVRSPERGFLPNTVMVWFCLVCASVMTNQMCDICIKYKDMNVCQSLYLCLQSYAHTHTHTELAGSGPDSDFQWFEETNDLVHPVYSVDLQLWVTVVSPHLVHNSFCFHTLVDFSERGI